MKYQNIGLDIDGVIFDKYSFEIMWGMTYFQTKYPFIEKEWLKNKRGSHFMEQFDCSSLEAFNFWVFNIFPYILDYKAREDFSKLTKELLEEGKNVYIVTGRKERKYGLFCSLMLVFLTKWQLKKNEIGYTDIFFCANSNNVLEKYKIVKDLNIDLMVDDDTAVLRKIKTCCDVVCFKNPYHTEKLLDMSYVSSAHELKEYILKREKKDNGK